MNKVTATKTIMMMMMMMVMDLGLMMRLLLRLRADFGRKAREVVGTPAPETNFD